MLDFNAGNPAWESLFGIPIEFWLVGGFLWQRFNITCYLVYNIK
jgi:hypothetical protein